MKTKIPATRRKFASAWDEIKYLYDKLLYWFYSRQLPQRARVYAKRLQKLVKQVDGDEKSILGQECRSLICEIHGDLAGAIRHREEEIRKIRRLHKISENTPQWDLACRDMDYTYLSDQLDLLALLYDAAGDTRKAIRTLEESKEFCGQHQIPFGGQKILKELRADSPLDNQRNGKSRRNTVEVR